MVVIIGAIPSRSGPGSGRMVALDWNKGVQESRNASSVEYCPA